MSDKKNRVENAYAHILREEAVFSASPIPCANVGTVEKKYNRFVKINSFFFIILPSLFIEGSFACNKCLFFSELLSPPVEERYDTHNNQFTDELGDTNRIRQH